MNPGSIQLRMLAGGRAPRTPHGVAVALGGLRWSTRIPGDPNVVEVYIGYLRKKIDQPFARASIETVRGAGYRLAGDGRTRNPTN